MRSAFIRYAARYAVFAVVFSGIACAGEEGAGGDEPADRPAGSAPAAAMPAPTGAVDSALAARGEELFRTRACMTCHTVGGGRLVGPDLSGATDRREFGWMMAMIQKPDSMIRADSIARQLFAEYMTPMANQGITADEARALYEYLRREDSQ